MELSYAQNLEDYHLAQVFAGQRDGFYIDVGAGHPVADNVSFWFYLQGWRGLVVEPQAALADLYAHVRPRDRAVCGLVGRADGVADFHVVDRLHGFSTMNEAHARGAAAFGADYRTRQLPVTTLARLCEQHAVERIDFLKVDVEGAEADVLAGADWRRWRPRVVVVEAVTPGSMAESWADWEPLLVQHRYAFAFFDGLNRFYVAEEEPALASRLPRQPTAWDAVPHLYAWGRARDNVEHPDHALARKLTDGFLAALPRLAPDLLLALLTHAEPGALERGAAPEEARDVARLLFGKLGEAGVSAQVSRPPASVGQAYRDAMQSDLFRAALGRIASCYDGGQIME
ncbi:MAG TPA: FkbM family methyltransferase [Beijerinckiaceae bacterium]|nr:FkbM family methyltransferase [Beijerinckiaceae bacterium]